MRAEGGFGALRLRGWVGGACTGLGWEFGRFRFGTQINTGFSFKWVPCGSSHRDVTMDLKWGSASGEGRKIPTPKLTGIVGSCDGYGWFGRRWGLSGSPKGLMDPNVVLVLEITDVMITGMFSENFDWKISPSSSSNPFRFFRH